MCATDLNNLAELYRVQGLYDQAEPLYERAIAILKKTFPNGHPNIKVTEDNYVLMKKERDAKK